MFDLLSIGQSTISSAPMMLIYLFNNIDITLVLVISTLPIPKGHSDTQVFSERILTCKILIYFMQPVKS